MIQGQGMMTEDRLQQNRVINFYYIIREYLYPDKKRNRDGI